MTAVDDRLDMTSWGGRTVAVLGCLGLVGRTLVESLVGRAHPWREVRLLDSPQRAGEQMVVRGQELVVQELTSVALAGVDVALCALPPAVAREWAVVAVEAGATVIDCSGEFRDEPDVPLIAASVNLDTFGQAPRGIISSPSSLSLAALTALAPLNRQWGIHSVGVTALMPASASGSKGLERLTAEMAALADTATLGQRAGDVRAHLLDHMAEQSSPFSAPLALNVASWVGSEPAPGVADSAPEVAFHSEVTQLLGDDEIRMAVTCLQVPVLVGETIVFNIAFKKPVNADGVREVLVNAPHVVVLGDSGVSELPVPIDAVGSAPAFAGRIRQQPGSPRAISFVQCSDNLRLGSALNAVTIAEALTQQDAIR